MNTNHKNTEKKDTPWAMILLALGSLSSAFKGNTLGDMFGLAALISVAGIFYVASEWVRSKKG